MPYPEQGVVFNTRKEVDFVIIGSGAAGGVLAKELSVAGFDVVVLEQGPYRLAADFVKHDEFKVLLQNDLMNHPSWNDPQTFRHTENEVATARQSGLPPRFTRALWVAAACISRQITAVFTKLTLMNAACWVKCRGQVLWTGPSVMQISSPITQK